MTRGAILFAFNSPDYDYVKMAEFTAKRVKHFLNLPCTLITDINSAPANLNNIFDQIITMDSDSSNQIDGRTWLNKGRYRCYELSPYDETLLLDVDYVVSSNKLNTVFDLMNDFMCHDTISYLMIEHDKKEHLNERLSLPILWATVIAFKKTNRVKQIFECLKMVQENYEHYANIHKFPIDTYRNDYGLTLAWRIVNGHSHINEDIIPWPLLHIHPKTRLHRTTLEKFDTGATIIYDKYLRGKLKKVYLQITDTDFHVIDKPDFMRFISHE
jgi:hypothetical protein